MQDFSGIWVPLVTPFSNGTVDHDGLRRLVQALSATGIAGLVVCGSTGEAAALDESEQAAVLRTVRDACQGLPVIVGVSGVTPQSVAARVARLAEFSPAGVLVPPPYYVRPSQRGIEDFFTMIAGACAVPVVLYDIPARTGVRIETATMLLLASHPNIRAVKDCSGDPDHVQAIVNDGRLQLLAGDDHRMFATMCQGGVGAIAASAHLRPDLFAALHRHVRANDLHAAATLWRSLWPLTKALFDEPSPGPVKAALAHRLGLHDELRAPMSRASSACARRAIDAVSGIDAAWPAPTDPCSA
jgi:4-hydroxy-tetrahydrodipicolinate synthase